MRTVVSLNDSWQFWLAPQGFTPAELGDGAIAVTVPHSWNAVDGQSGDGYARRCTAYQRQLTIPADAGERFFVEFEGANAVCDVWVGDAHLGQHRGGYATFRFEITDFVKPGETVTLTAFVDNSETEDVSPLTGDFTVFGGIYRNVNLVCVPKAHFALDYYGTSGLLLTPTVNEDGTAQLAIETRLTDAEGMKVLYTVTAPNGETAAQAEGDGADLVIPFAQPVLWNGKQAPAMYAISARLMDGDTVLDEVGHSFGFRSIRMDPETGFYLNGVNMPLHGVAKHQDRCDCGNAVSREQLDEDMALVRELNCNCIRLSHYQHPQYFYDLCDQEGLVVWAEIPMLEMTECPALLENARQQLTELVLQNRHHPGICFWGIQNEIAIAGETLPMYRSMEKLQEHVKALDPTRISTSANLYCVKNNSPLNEISDVVAYNIYFGWYYGKMEEYADFFDAFHKDNPHIPLGVSEYGVDCNLGFHSDTPKLKDYSEEFQALFHETVYPIMEERPYVWGTYVWNMFDFGSASRNEGGTKGRNCKGLVSYDRKIRKDSFFYYKAAWSNDPFVHITSRRFAKRATGTITVKVYSNCSEVSLEVNGEAFGTAAGSRVFVFENVPLQAGENTVIARSGDCVDTVVWEKVEQPEQSYIYVDPNPGFNVANWFTLGESEEDLFPEDKYSLMDTLKDLTANPETMALITGDLPQLVSHPMFQKAGSFTLMKIVNRMSGMFDEDVVQALNRKLNKISKPNT